ncbi:hypothetical protein [Novosphingobium sp.]|uniref:hypothetical protein n=1 Tax=Novosphingobium sp. TaxID=1874826 RepID=UPI0031D6158F
MSIKRYSAGMLLSALLALAVTDRAEAAPTPKGCAFVTGLLEKAVTPQSKVEMTEAGCHITDVQLKKGTYQSWMIADLSVAGLEGWDRKSKTFPSHIKLTARGIRFFPQIGNSHTRYQIALTQKPFDVRLDAGFDLASKQIVIRELALESPWIGHIGFEVEASFAPDEAGGPDQPSLQDMKGGLRILHTRLVLDNRTLFEGMLMPMIIAMIPPDDDPAEVIPKWQKKAEADLRKLPDSLVDAASRDALIRFTRDFPHPTGHFDLDIRLARPLGLGELKPGKDGNNPLKGAKLTAVYETPTAPAK